MAMFAIRLRSSAPQGDNGRRALEAFEAIVIKTYAQPVTDKLGGNGPRGLALPVVVVTLPSLAVYDEIAATMGEAA